VRVKLGSGVPGSVGAGSAPLLWGYSGSLWIATRSKLCRATLSVWCYQHRARLGDRVGLSRPSLGPTRAGRVPRLPAEGHPWCRPTCRRRRRRCAIRRSTRLGFAPRRVPRSCCGVPSSWPLPSRSPSPCYTDSAPGAPRSVDGLVPGWGPGRGHRSATLRRDGVAATRGFDGGTKISVRTRHIAADTLGLLLAVCGTRPVPHDCDGAHPLLAAPVPAVLPDSAGLGRRRLRRASGRRGLIRAAPGRRRGQTQRRHHRIRGAGPPPSGARPCPVVSCVGLTGVAHSGRGEGS